MRRFSLLGLISGTVLWMMSAPVYAVSALLLGIPGFVAANSCSALTYTRRLAGQDGINISDRYVIKRLQNMESIELHPDVLLRKVPLLGHYSALEIERKVAGGEWEDPVYESAGRLVRDLRKLGMNDITVSAENIPAGLLGFVYNSLGIRRSTGTTPDLLILLKQEEQGIREKGTLWINGNHINQIPWLIIICRKSDEYLVRAQVTSAMLHVFGIMLAFFGWMGIGAAVLLSILTMLGSRLYLKHHILHSNKEIPYGEQSQYITAGV